MKFNIVFTHDAQDPISLCDEIVDDAWGNSQKCLCKDCKGTIRDSQGYIILCGCERCVGKVRVLAETDQQISQSGME